MEGKVVYVWGPAFCGSTIFGTVLGSHSKTRTFGELQKFANNSDKLSRSREWIQKILDRVEKNGSIQTKKVHPVILQLIDEDILIDISKSINNWEALHNKQIAYQHIILYREMCGNRYSYLKHQTNHDIENLQVDNQLKQDVEKRLSITLNRYKYVDDIEGAKLSVRYKDFCQNTKEATQDICNFMGINFEEDMLRFWEHDHRIFGGSRSIRYFIEEDHPYREELPKYEKKKYYDRPKIEYNDSWKHFLPDKLIEFISNHRYTKEMEEIVKKYKGGENE